MAADVRIPRQRGRPAQPGPAMRSRSPAPSRVARADQSAARGRRPALPGQHVEHRGPGAELDDVETRARARQVGAAQVVDGGGASSGRDWAAASRHCSRPSSPAPAAWTRSRSRGRRRASRWWHPSPSACRSRAPSGSRGGSASEDRSIANRAGRETSAGGVATRSPRPSHPGPVADAADSDGGLVTFRRGKTNQEGRRPSPSFNETLARQHWRMRPRSRGG